MHATTATVLQDAVHHLSQYGLHLGRGFVGPATNPHFDHGPLAVCAAVFLAATRSPLPEAFYGSTPEQEEAATDLIKANSVAMAAIHAIWNSLDSKITAADLCEEITTVDGPDEWIDRVSYWSATAPASWAQPPTLIEVIGRLMRTAEDLSQALAA
jgi:hypothetical protein